MRRTSRKRMIEMPRKERLPDIPLSDKKVIIPPPGKIPFISKTKKGKGRPSKLRPEIIRFIITAIRSGATISAACESAGIGISTYHQWLDIARTQKEQGKTSDYTEFMDALDKAFADFEVSAVAEIRAAGKKDYNATLKLLRARKPEEFGVKKKVETNLEGDIHIVFEDVDVDDDETEEKEKDMK
jgi:hypothetical protein